MRQLPLMSISSVSLVLSLALFMFPFCVLRISYVDGVVSVSHRHSAVHNNTNTNLHHYLQFLAPTKKKYK